MAATLAREFDAANLLAALPVIPRRITADSRSVRRGDAFAAYRGHAADGRAYIRDAVERGAGAVLWDPDGYAWDAAIDVPQLPVDDLRAKLGAIADAVYGHPSRSLFVAGVTGTNGKTTCASWIAQCLERTGRHAALIGTLGYGLLDYLRPALNTTPDAAVVHEKMADFRDAGAEAVAMEVSSHALEQGRVNAVAFDVALFTNLTRDHLDYHGTMAAYGAAKARLFAWPGLDAAVINIDDPFGRSLADAARARGQHVLTYGLERADVAATAVSTSRAGIALSVATPWGRGDVAIEADGVFNALNALGVLGVVLASGIEFEDALWALAQVSAPPGRMQRLGGGAQPLVVVDYAHTPDALQNALDALRPAVAAGGELVCVFGCGGDRDPGKRPQMGRIAALLADRVVVTSDNPRNEEPAAIAAAVVEGVREAGGAIVSVELDRAAAIADAVAQAHPGDVVLIAGKGHEDYQERRGVRVHFSDAEAATGALASRGAQQ